MNERIDKLLVKAGAYFGGEGVVYDAFDPKKFAELIIRECIELAMNERLRYSSSYNKEAGWAKQLMMIHCATSMDNYKILLQEHFGVEE